MTRRRRRSAVGRAAGTWQRGSGASATQVSVTARLTGVCCRHGQAVLAGRRLLQARDGTGARAWDGHGEDDRQTTGRRAGVRASECAGGRPNGERVDGQAGGRWADTCWGWQTRLRGRCACGGRARRGGGGTGGRARAAGGLADRASCRHG